MRAEPTIDNGVPASSGGSGFAVALLGGGAAMAVAAGGLLWWRYGGAVFTDLVTAGLAWCF